MDTCEGMVSTNQGSDQIDGYEGLRIHCLFVRFNFGRVLLRNFVEDRDCRDRPGTVNERHLLVQLQGVVVEKLDNLHVSGIVQCQSGPMSRRSMLI